MLKLTLQEDEYLTINGDIIIHLAHASRSGAELAIEADRSIPIVRGDVLERQGGQRPDCLTPKREKRVRQ